MPVRRALLALALLALAAFALWLALGPKPEGGALTVEGNVDVRQADLSFKVAGRIAAMAVQEGEHVKAGQRLAVLEKTDYEIALAESEAALAARAQNLAELENGSRPEEIRQARAALAEAEAALTDARLIEGRTKDLLAHGDVAQQALDSATAALDRARARRDGAKASLALVLEGARKERIEAARAQRDEAASARDEAKRHLDDTELSAPEEGVILTRIREPGVVVGAGDPVYGIVLVRPVWVRAYVGEPDLERLKPGMDALVRTDGGRRYKGHLGYVSPLAEFTPKTVQSPDQRVNLVYRLRVVVDDADEALRQGMPVSVDFGTAAR